MLALLQKMFIVLMKSLGRGVRIWSLNNEPAYSGEELLSWNRNDFMHSNEFRDCKRFVTQKIGAEYSLPWRSHVYSELALSRINDSGVFVEAGVGQGHMPLFTLRLAKLRNQKEPEFHLFDRFEPWLVDKVSGEQSTRVQPGYASNLTEVKASFEDFKSIVFHPGDICLTAPNFSKRISFAHIDLNNVAGEICALSHFFKLINPGGVILLDDFGQRKYSAQHDAIVAWCKEQGIPSPMYLPTGQGLLIRK